MNKEDKKAKRKAYYQANRAKIADYNKAHAEKRHAYNKAWREANPEKDRAYKKAWYQANKERVTRIQKVWYKANPEKVRRVWQKRWALKHTTQAEPISEKVIYLRDGWICQICKKRVDKRFKWPHPMSRTLDHITPLSKGGTHTYNNIQLAHLGCNSSKRSTVLPQGEQLRIF